MFENYEMAMEWDVRELTGWDMEDMERGGRGRRPRSRI